MIRSLLMANIAAVGVGYPALRISEGCIRACISAAHTKEQLDYALEVIQKVSNQIGIRCFSKPQNPKLIDYYKLKTYHND